MLPRMMTAQNTQEPAQTRETIRAHALTRAQIGWTRNESTDAHLRALASMGLARHLGTEIRLAAVEGSQRRARVWAGSRWELTPEGKAALLQLPGVSGDEIPTWHPSEVASSDRISAGVYRVELANGAKATIARADAITSASAGLSGWHWIERLGGVSGFPTKAKALESFRQYRG